MRRPGQAAVLLLAVFLPTSLGAQPGNDDLARLASFLPPPPPPPPPAAPPPQQQQKADEQNGQPRRKPWRDLLDALLDATAPRDLIADSIADDPLTTGFGNEDLVEPSPREAAAAQPKPVALPKRHR
ncbi:MAG: hypothetical protein IBJ13_10355 [Sphingopyxis sp.]|nr:hypothetical protein [Sphingopyxis sp.]